MSKGADVNGCNEKGFSPIYAATLSSRSSQLVALLLGEGADPNRAKQNTALYNACLHENFQIGSMLIDGGADVNPKTCSPFVGGM